MKSKSHGEKTAAKTISVDDYDLQNSLVKAIIEASPEGILVVDGKNVVVSHNQRCLEVWRIPDYRLAGIETDAVIGADDNYFISNALERVKDIDSFVARIKELYENPQLNDHCEIELKDGRTLERHSTVLRNNDGQYLGRVWFFRDITTQKQTEVVLKELAHLDPLTGVANRRYFFERANQEFSRSKRHSTPLAMAELDIDHFKQINDQHGHAVGDKVLKSFCSTIQKLLRETDIFARIGGEEFAVLLPDTNLDGAVCLTERLRRVIAGNKLALDGKEFKYTVSIGVTMLKISDAAIEDCLLRADKAMYRAKQNGRNRVENGE
jgi:diguanylate cyclase (GGDEF)-like protein